MINDAELLKLNSKGLIPGPEESEEQFKKRAEQSLNLIEILTCKLQEKIPFSKEDLIPSNNIKSAYDLSKSLYGITPEWVPIFFSNYKLAPWQGGCMWSFQTEENSPPCALLQLRKKLKTSPNYLKIYHRDELTAHEMAHVGRMAFQEPQFEEILAYRSSPSKFRRWFGPIVQSAIEASIFLLTLIAVLLLNLSFVVWEIEELYPLAIWSQIVPFLLILFAIARLALRHSTFSKCLENLNKVLNDPEKANAVIYRLTDKEIKQFSKLTPEEIDAYIKEQKDATLRWRAIFLVYSRSS